MNRIAPAPFSIIAFPQRESAPAYQAALGAVTNLQTYPQWQRPYQAALIECDSRKLVHRVDVAELAMRSRLREIQAVPGETPESQAIRDALDGLRILKLQIQQIKSSQNLITSARGEYWVAVPADAIARRN